MLAQLRDHLREEGMTRIDCGCHRDNEGAWRFYQRLGFVSARRRAARAALA
jgi:ribosomal protein S18 acetylase RimI-like enzyme